MKRNWNNRSWLRGCLGVSLASLALGACGTPAQGVATGTQDSGALTDSAGSEVVASFDASGGGTDGSASADDTGGVVDGFIKGDFVWLTFSVDDSANQTFSDGDILWTGSFSWDEATNTITYATSWLPTDGPFVALYDDGPQPTGHEKAGATAGDHVFTNQVKFVATKDTQFEYGALNEFNNWMWVGANGLFTILQGQGGVVDVPGMKLKKFGAVDAKVTIDLKALNAAYASWNANDYKFFVKGTLNQWTPVQLLDDGQKGDAAAGDGVLTFVLKQNLGKHDGPLNPGDEVQFTFVATQGDQDPIDGQEYKQAGNGLPDGVAAWTATGADGAWESVPVVMAKDSKGKTQNTAFVVPGAPVADCDPTCAIGQKCVNGACVSAISCDPPCTAGEQCVTGLCKPISDADAVSGPDVSPDVTVVDCIPACAVGQSCVNGVCEGPMPNVTLTGITPKWAQAKGGTVIQLQGTQLSAGWPVAFLSTADPTLGGQATNVVFGPGQDISATTPPLPPVPADVRISPVGMSPLTLPAALDVVPVDTPFIDGLLGADWNAMSLAAINDLLSTWSDPVNPAKANELTQLWVAYDAQNFYLGLKGTSEAQNALICYLDVDYGAGTGVSAPSAISDNTGKLDNAISNVLTVADPQIGLDFAVGTVGMSTFAGGDLAGSAAAGWRALGKPSDLAWLQGVVQANPTDGAVEATIALAQLFPAGIPDDGVLVKIACALGNQDGSALSNQYLPSQGTSTPGVITNWWNVHVYPVAP